jgi:Ca2+-binding EF-hand superfamily protein
MRLWITGLGLVTLCCLVVATSQSQQPPAGQAGNPATNKATGGQPGTQNQQNHNDGKNAPRFDAARFLKDHDKNGDGKLSKDELPQTAQKDFDKIDTNKDGSISQDELQHYAEKMAQQRPQLVEIVWYAIDVPEEPVTTQELQEAYDQLRKLDKNHDGKIDEGELKAFREERKKERIDAIFHALDRNKDGKISKDEARGLWADNFTQLDKNKDGFLDQQEIEAACMMDTSKGQGGGNPTQPNKK